MGSAASLLGGDVVWHMLGVGRREKRAGPLQMNGGMAALR